jgi:hypothetical protein
MCEKKRRNKKKKKKEKLNPFQNMRCHNGPLLERKSYELLM